MYNKGMSRRHPQPKPAPPPEPAPGDPDRWANYVTAALRYASIHPQILPEKPILTFYGTIPGFEGLHYASSDGVHFLSYFWHTIEDWLEYRLANRLPIPLLPGVATPTLEDFEEYDAIRAYDEAKAEGGTPIPLDQALAMLGLDRAD